MDVFTIKRGDTAPALDYALIPTSVDLTGATVRFSMMTRAGAKVIDRAAASVVTATGTPTVRYTWAVGNTDARGMYRAEFEVTYSGGQVETFPNDGYIGVLIGAEI